MENVCSDPHGTNLTFNESPQGSCASEIGHLELVQSVSESSSNFQPTDDSEDFRWHPWEVF